MPIKHILFIRTFKNKSRMIGSYTKIDNDSAAVSGNLPTRDSPLLKTGLQEILDSYTERKIPRNAGDSADTIDMMRKVFDWQKQGVYYDSRVNKKSLNEFRKGLGLTAS